MDPLVVLFLVLIVVLGGVIGMLADYLGRRIGKKKLSFLNMRPRHVARVGTFLAGMATALVTILLVVALSSDVREWIVEGRQAIRRAQVAIDEVARAQRKIAYLGDQITADVRHNADLQAAGDQARAALVSSKNRLLAVRARLADVDRRLVEANQRAVEARARIASDTVALDRTKHRLADSRTRLAQVGGKLAESRANLLALKRSYSALDAQRIEANNEVVVLNSQAEGLKGQINDLSSAKEDLQRKIDGANADLARAQGELSAEQDSLTETRSNLHDAQTALDLAQREVKSYQYLDSTARIQPEIFAAGAELARVQAGPDLSEQDAGTALEHLLREARQAALAAGSADHDPVAFAPIRNDSQTIMPEDQQNAIVKGLVGSPKAVVLIAYSLVNSFKGERVLLKVKGFSNPVVYTRGAVVAETRIGRGWSRERVFAALNDFLRNGVMAKALAAGMIPAAGRENSLLDVAPAETLDVVSELTRSDRQVRLQAVTQSVTRAADALSLQFVIK